MRVEPHVWPDQRTFEIEAAMHGPWTFAEFHSVRNELLLVLIRFGTVGPMGKFSTEGDCEYLWDPHPDQIPTADRPDFFVVDDRYSTGPFHRVEADRHMLKSGLLDEVVSMLAKTNGWIVYFALGGGGLVVSADSIGHEGELFAGCDSIAELELRCGPRQ